MSARLTISFPDEVLRALRSGKSITLKVEAPGGPANASKLHAPRAGSLPARLISWSSTRKKPFTTSDVERRFHVSRAHASMLLSRMAGGPHPIRRMSRGLYSHE
ncbi:MAG: hypothetical protein V3T86_11390 [Planctomycetota bacterium]